MLVVVNPDPVVYVSVLFYFLTLVLRVIHVSKCARMLDKHLHDSSDLMYASARVCTVRFECGDDSNRSYYSFRLLQYNNMQSIFTDIFDPDS